MPTYNQIVLLILGYLVLNGPSWESDICKSLSKNDAKTWRKVSKVLRWEEIKGKTELVNTHYTQGNKIAIRRV